MIETERLIIQPLSYDQLKKYIRVDNSLEKELGLKDSDRSISADLKDAFENSILPNVADPAKNYLFYTLWTIILKEEERMVADLRFVGEPNENGEVEIGYGTYEKHQGKGFMTEAVAGMINWAKQDLNIRALIASTEKTNPASFAVLEKNGFLKVSEDDTLYHWKLLIEQ